MRRRKIPSLRLRRGYGGSTRVTEWFDQCQVGEDIRLLMEAQGFTTFAVVGFDLGAHVAFHFAAALRSKAGVAGFRRARICAVGGADAGFAALALVFQMDKSVGNGLGCA